MREDLKLVCGLIPDQLSKISEEDVVSTIKAN